jgi:hypothetical protein
MKQRILWPVGCSIALLACGGGGNGGMPPPNPGPSDCSTGIATPLAVPSLSFASPVAMLQAPNDASRWFVVEQGGKVRAFENDSAATTAEDFVDLRSRVHMDGEAGLARDGVSPGLRDERARLPQFQRVGRRPDSLRHRGVHQHGRRADARALLPSATC